MARNSEKQTDKLNDDSLIEGVIYRHPDHSYRTFKHKLCQTILKMNKEKKKFMIVGDLNIDLLKRDSDVHG